MYEPSHVQARTYTHSRRKDGMHIHLRKTVQTHRHTLQLDRYDSFFCLFFGFCLKSKLSL